jgi:hypothetical protein
MTPSAKAVPQVMAKMQTSAPASAQLQLNVFRRIGRQSFAEDELTRRGWAQKVEEPQSEHRPTRSGKISLSVVSVLRQTRRVRVVPPGEDLRLYLPSEETLARCDGV